MTEAQIEAAARKLCELRGIDPEQWVYGEPKNAPRWWHAAREEIRARLQVDEAIEFGKGQ